MRLLRGITPAVLVVLVGGGWFGGLSFLTDPKGGGMGMTTAELPHWPLLVLWMLGQVVALGLTFPAMQLTFLAVGLALTALGAAGRRLRAGERVS